MYTTARNNVAMIHNFGRLIFDRWDALDGTTIFLGLNSLDGYNM